MPADLVTSRLVLIAITPAMLHAELAADGQLSTLTRAQVPADWPWEEWEPHVLEFLLKQFEQHPQQIAWNRYIALREPRMLIGGIGCFALESEPTQAELGYGLLPEYEGHGYATEAAREVIAHVCQTPSLTSLIAHTYPHLQRSIRVMEKCGFALEGPGGEPGTVRYRLIL